MVPHGRCMDSEIALETAEDVLEKARAVRDEDPSSAAELFRRAAEMGSVPAAASLGYMLMVGEGVRADPAEAERLLSIAAESGDTSALCNLGFLLSESDPGRAVSYLERAAETGSAKAMKNLGAMHYSGHGIPADKVKAAEWYSKAADSGDADSICVLASMYRNGDGVPVDKARAASLYRRAADMGESDAQYDLAFMLDAGEGIPEDKEEAERYFRLSADQGDSDACLCMGGICFERGEYKEAEEYFLTAALKGDVKAEYNIGLLYHGGYLGAADEAKAAEWFGSAADKGFVLAHTMLGAMAMDSGNAKEAEKRFRTAAEQGEPTAMYNLGAMGLSGNAGLGFEEAVGLVARAASAGYEPAYELLTRLNSQRRRGALRGTLSPRCRVCRPGRARRAC